VVATPPTIRRPQAAQNRGGSSARVQPVQSATVRPQLVQNKPAGISTAVGIGTAAVI
jgi:hypothetical protein